jgi:hypothetical protein
MTGISLLFFGFRDWMRGMFSPVFPVFSFQVLALRSHPSLLLAV